MPHKSKKPSRKRGRGFTVSEQSLNDGSIKLQIIEGAKA
jgi:hypothetical protein